MKLQSFVKEVGLTLAFYTTISLSYNIPSDISQAICQKNSLCPCPSPSIWSLPSSQAIWKQPYSKSSISKMNELITQDPNLGGGIFKIDASKKTILRSSLMSNNSLCLSEIIQSYQIKSIVNLYDRSYLQPDDASKEISILKKN